MAAAFLQPLDFLVGGSPAADPFQCFPSFLLPWDPCPCLCRHLLVFSLIKLPGAGNDSTGDGLNTP